MDTAASIKQPVKHRNVTSQLARGLDNWVRRSLDILASFFGLLFLSPFFLYFSIQLHRDSPGPVFFRGPRVGRHGREFGILKFRTMYERPASYAGPCLTGSNDDRVTPFGRWLRDTKMNELPQLWNVLVGDMSLVGPRPEDPEIAAKWPPEVREELLSVRLGMTSPASINFRDEEKLLSTSNLMEDYLKQVLPSKLRLDILYIRRRTVLNDLDVIFLTLVALLPQLRKKSIPQDILYNGPLNRFMSRVVNWFVVDWIVSLAAVAFSGIVWRLSAPLDVGVWNSVVVALLIALIFSITNLVFRLNRVSWRTARAEAVVELALSAALATFAIVLINSLKWLPIHLPTGMLVLSGVLAFLGCVVARYRERILTGLATRWLLIRRAAPAFGERVLIVGAGEMGGMVSWLIKHGEFARVFSMVGYVDDDPDKTGMLMDGSPVLGMSQDVPALIEKYDVGLVIFAISNVAEEHRRSIFSMCKRAGVQVVAFPNVLEIVKSSLLPEAGQPSGWIERRDVSSMLGELNEIMGRGDLALARARLVEMQQQFTVQEAD